MTTSPDDIRKEPLDPSVLYRVRDGKGSDETKPCIVWGENLTWDEANALKESVVGSEKSRTARLEPMGVAPPSLVTAATPPNPDPELADVMARGLAAARGPAMAAQARVDAAASAPAAPIDLSTVMPNVEQIADIDLDLGDGDSADLPEDGDDQAELDAQLAEYEARGKALYEAILAAGHPDWIVDVQIRHDLRRQWEDLSVADRAAICFHAVNYQVAANAT